MTCIIHGNGSGCRSPKFPWKEEAYEVTPTIALLEVLTTLALAMTTATTGDEAAIRKATKSFFAAWNRGDIKGLGQSLDGRRDDHQSGWPPGAW